ncbi:MAG: VWA domain-containing protein, partial [Nitrososphaera sp.]|nr:VWA domain-containing protein [Nitrososphaera sp.]
VQSLKKDAKGDQANIVSLIKFGHGVQTLRAPTALSEFKELTIEEYNPNAWTPLYDGIGYAIAQAEAGFEKYKNFDNAAVLFILTDGQENHSKEFNQAQVSARIKELQKEGRFTFNFMGCSDALIHAAQTLGIYKGNTIVWDYSPMGIGVLACANQASTKSFFDARDVGFTATSGFYGQNGYMGGADSAKID